MSLTSPWLLLAATLLLACGGAPPPPPHAAAPITGPRPDAAVLAQIAANTLCPDPTAPCPATQMHAFEPHELSFHANVQARREALDSLPFLAVVLDTQRAQGDGTTAEEMQAGQPPRRPCGGYFGEPQRLAAQRLFPRHKVFASRTGCGASVISYAGTAPDENILAVYAGQTEAEARAVLEEARRTGRYPAARLVRTWVQLLTFN